MLNFYLSLTNRNMATRRNVTGSVNTTGRTPIQYPPEPEFTSNLTSSLIPWASVWTITYSRATPATVLDHEGMIRYVKSGEARFQGARRVENLHTYSEDITNAAWTPQSCTRTKNAWIAPDGTNTAWLVTSNIATALTEFFQNYSIVSGQTYILSVSLKANGWLQYVQLVWNGATFWLGYINVDLSNGTITAHVPWTANMQATVTPEANWFYRIQFKATAISTIAGNHLSVAMIPSSSSIRIATFPWDGIKWFYYWHPQFEDVTGQSIQTAAEYVSTNVLSSPFHGAMVDGVKYFDTDINGTPIPDSTLKGYFAEWARTNLFLQSEDFLTTWWLVGIGAVTTNQTTAPNGTMTADLFTLAASFGAQWVTQSLTTTASVYAQSIYVKSNGHNFVQCNADGGISLWYVNFDLSTGTVTTQSLWTGSIESLPNGWYRLRVVTNTISATTANVSFAAVPSSTATRGQTAAGTGTSGFYIWGAQLELWWVVSSYIPTTTTTVTRNIDVLTYDVKNAIANKWALSAVFHMNDSELFDRRAISLSASNNNRLQLPLRRPGVQNVSLFYWDGASVQSVLGATLGTNNVAVSWTNWVGAYVFMNNTKYSSVAVPNLIFSMVDVGGGMWYSLFWCVKNVRIWKTPPTDTELLFLSNNP